jgi:hypothetical protein
MRKLILPKIICRSFHIKQSNDLNQIMAGKLKINYAPLWGGVGVG